MEGIRGSSVSIRRRVQAGRQEFDYRQGQWWDIFIFATASRPAPGLSRPSIQRVPGKITPGVRWPGSETDHLPPTSAEVKNTRSIPPLPQYFFMAWYLVKDRNNLTFTFTKSVFLLWAGRLGVWRTVLHFWQAQGFFSSLRHQTAPGKHSAFHSMDTGGLQLSTHPPSNTMV
jgi:hypothetical protein